MILILLVMIMAISAQLGQDDNLYTKSYSQSVQVVVTSSVSSNVTQQKKLVLLSRA